ncbi:MAG: radical SAM protein [Byssovorax sp.]
MQLSRFLVTYESVRTNEHVLYNVLSDRYVGLNDAALASIARSTAGSGDEDDEAIAGELASQGFLVDDRAHDDRHLREHLARVARSEPGVMSITFMPTLACNLACTYCFQKGSPAYNTMSRETEEQSIEFILRKVDEAGSRELRMEYFGGEPLARKDVVLRTAEILSRSMAARGGVFSWHIITNGVNLDLPFVEAMNRFGPGGIKVTLDGDKETHDQARVYRSGKGSFDVIFENLTAVAGHVRLDLGGNFLPGQQESYTRLIERLDQAGILKKLSAVKFKPAQATAKNDLGTCAGGCGSAKEETETLLLLDRLVRKKRPEQKTSETLDGLVAGPCELHWDNSYILDPDGLVYKCPAVAGRPEVAVGTVRDNALKGAPLLELRPWEKCGDCAYLPVCVGGCLGGQYLKTGRRDEVNCKKEWFETSFREAVPRRYLAELADTPWDGADA